MEIRVSKDDYSENIVRKALYWLTEDAEWVYGNNEKEFIITLATQDEKEMPYIKAKLHRLLNDFYLRQKIDDATKQLRNKIIEQALTKVYLHNAQV